MTNKPTMKYSCGSVSVAVWDNEIETPNGTRTVQRVTVDRSYKDKDGAWKHTDSFNVNDIPRLMLALQKAFEHMVCKGKDNGDNGEDDGHV
jgi:hypothetical protein